MQRPIQTLLSAVSTSIITDTTFNNIWKRIQIHIMKRGKEVTRTNPYVKTAGSSVGNSRCWSEFPLNFVVTLCTTQFNIHKFCILHTQYINVLCMHLRTIFYYFPILHSGRWAGIATRYGWMVRESNPEEEGRRDFPYPSRPNLEPTQPPIQWVPCLVSGGKAAGAWRWTPTPYLAPMVFVACCKAYLSYTPLATEPILLSRSASTKLIYTVQCVLLPPSWPIHAGPTLRPIPCQRCVVHCMLGTFNSRWRELNKRSHW